MPSEKWLWWLRARRAKLHGRPISSPVICVPQQPAAPVSARALGSPQTVDELTIFYIVYSLSNSTAFSRSESCCCPASRPSVYFASLYRFHFISRNNRATPRMWLFWNSWTHLKKKTSSTDGLFISFCNRRQVTGIRAIAVKWQITKIPILINNFLFHNQNHLGYFRNGTKLPHSDLKKENRSEKGAWMKSKWKQLNSM
jgi:hypothetical protein